MKIVHFIPSIDRSSGGVGAYIQLLAKELGKLCELYVVTEESDHPLEIENARVLYINCSWKHRRLMKQQWTMLLNHIKPDVVHINCCWLPSCAWTQKWAQKLGYKVVLTPHGMLEPWIIQRNYWTKKVPALLLYQKEAIVHADCIHATAESEKKNILKLGYNQSVAVIPNGIELEGISMKKSWERKKEILFLSRIHVKKGIEFLIEAVAILKNELREYKVKIAGYGDADYIQSLKEKARQEGVDEFIEFVGGVYGEDKWMLLKNADVFVLPTYSENFGIVVAEALACGTPVITTNGTPWEELNTEKCGWCIEVGIMPLVNAIKDFLSKNEQELCTMGQNARQLVENRYSITKIARQFVAFYKSVKS